MTIAPAKDQPKLDEVFSRLCKKINQDDQFANLEVLILAQLAIRWVLTEAQLREELTYKVEATDDGHDVFNAVLTRMVEKKLIQSWNPWQGHPGAVLKEEDNVYVLPSKEHFDPDPNEQAIPSTVSDAPQPIAEQTLADRLETAALIASGLSEHVGAEEKKAFRRISTAVAQELGQYLREPHGGSSQVADMLDGLLG